jgi:antitoxin (DNA-binding transcriptional repressor) of toxin-antitoxin stability system
MTITLTVSEARARLPELLDRVLAGDEVTITRHGAPVAVVLRPDRVRARRSQEAFDRAAAVHDLVLTARARVSTTGDGLSPDRADDLAAEVEAARAHRPR